MNIQSDVSAPLLTKISPFFFILASMLGKRKDVPIYHHWLDASLS